MHINYWLSQATEDHLRNMRAEAGQRRLVHIALGDRPSLYRHTLYAIGSGMIALGQRLQGELTAPVPSMTTLSKGTTKS